MKTSYSMTARAAIALTLLAAAAGSAVAKDGDDRNEGRSVEPTVAVPTNGNIVPGTKDNFDPTYNVCRGTDARCYHPWVADRQNKVLLYTRTAGPRHANLGPALPPGKNPALLPAHVVQNTIIKWMAEHGVTVDWTEDVNQINNLNQYKAVIFASTSRDTLFKHGTAVNPARALDTTTGAHLDSAKTAMRQYMRAGGGFVAIHNAFGTEYNWPWYEGLLGNANYYDHGQFQNGDIEIVSRDSSTEGLPRRFGFKDEWYNLVPFPTNVKFLATVDENSLATKRTVHPGHGDFHPVAWCQYYDGGRAWLTTLGHDRDAFTDGSGFPGQNEFKQFLVNGILSAMGNKPFCTD